jgi:molybdenum cofactor synthesis domain-containing protein
LDGHSTAVIVTIGNEIVSGDIANSNGSWLAQRLEALGVHVRLIAAVPDDVDEIAAFVREQAANADVVVVTGGLGGTPDDVTREAIASAFDLEQRGAPGVAGGVGPR